MKIRERWWRRMNESMAVALVAMGGIVAIIGIAYVSIKVMLNTARKR
jgi:hypothetical protein